MIRFPLLAGMHLALRKRYFAAIVVALSTVAITTGCGPRLPVRAVLVTIDSLRLDVLLGEQTEGGAASSMPRLLARSRAGAVFESFYAATPDALPSVASMLTGLHPWDHGLLHEHSEPLAAGIPSVAEVLAERGYFTGAVVAAPGSRRWSDLQRGFEAFWDGTGPGASHLSRSPDPGAASTPSTAAVEEVTKEALRLLDHASEGSSAIGPGQFLWIHYGEPDDGAVRRGRLAYGRDASSLDRELERLLSRLEDDASRFETHVVLAATHAGRFGGGGAVGRRAALTEEQIRAPLVILSGRVDHRVRRDVAGSVDVGRTLLSLAGVKYPGPPWSAARDLSAWAPDPSIDPEASSGIRVGAVGMARPYATADGVIDRTAEPLDQRLFYAVDRAGRLFVGNEDGLVDRPAGSSPTADDLAQELFQALATRVGRRRGP